MSVAPHHESTPKPFHALSVDDTLKTLSSRITGLTHAEVQHNVSTYGRNVLPEGRRVTRLQLFIRQLNSALILILCAAAAVSIVLRDYSDATIIIAAIIINTIVGYIQESKAHDSLESLRHVIAAQVTVVRDATEHRIDVAQLVPGDVIVCSAGDKIPADARVMHNVELEVNEAVLTGESASVLKDLAPTTPSATLGDRTSMVFAGTTVLRGSARAVVVATGAHTEIGKIAALISRTQDQETPLQQRLNQLGRIIGVIVVAICAVIFVFGIFSDIPFVEALTTAIAVAVSAIPEGLAMAVTVILAIGMQRILRRHALVRNLQAAETLGSTSVICTDKTGTLTEGHMQIVSVMTRDYHFTQVHRPEHHEVEGLEEMMFALRIGMLCNDAHIVTVESATEEKTIVGNMTDQALLAAGLHVGLSQQQLETQEPRISTLPFDSTQKMMATLHAHPTLGRRIYIKGAPERILTLATRIRLGEKEVKMSEDERAQFAKRCMEQSAKGLRIIAVAYVAGVNGQEHVRPQDIHDLVFVGCLCIQDPLREGIADVFAQTAAAGIHTVIITGDHPVTARAIASDMGLHVTEEEILDGERLQSMTQDQLNTIVTRIRIYARVSPKDKLNIIQAWQSHGKVVAMTGDGVNDAPALKAANIGIALGSGTDVAKEAADIVLLDNQFSTIVAAVEEGRGIFETIRKVVLYLLGDSFSEVIVVTGALFLGMPLPLSAAQILWINLVSDGLPNIALTVDPQDGSSMSRPPRSPQEPVMNRTLLAMVVSISLFTGVWNLVLHWYMMRTTGDLALANTIVFANLALDSLVYVFSVRSLHVPVWKSNVWNNPWLLLSVIAAFCIQLVGMYTPFFQGLLGTTSLNLYHWGIVSVSCVAVLITFEALKYIFHRSLSYHV